MKGSRISRRTFLKGVAITGAVVGSAAAGTNKLGFFEEVAQANTMQKIETKYGVCGICGMSCALVGHVVDGNVVKLEGNALDLQSGGQLCAKGNSGINLLYDPDRIKSPLLRTNPEKGIGVDPKWKKISWEEAYKLAAEKLQTAIKSDGPKSVIWIGKHKGTDFLKAIGSPNDICHHSTCDTVRHVVCHTMLGASSFIPDFEYTDYILSFGWDQMGKAKNAWARGVSEAVSRGAKLVVFDPRLSPTASKAKEWFPVKPGTDHAIVLAMLNVIIKEGLYKKEFVEAYTHGFEELKMEVSNYTPEWAANISGVKAEDIVKIAREFATAPRAVIPLHKREAVQVRKNGTSLAQGMLSLMIITGNVEKRGGLLLGRKAKLGKPEPVETPALETEVRIDGADKFPILLGKPLDGEGIMQTVPDAILARNPYPSKVAIVYAQSLIAMNQPEKFAKALASLDFVININIQPDDMATLADLILPESSYLESATVSPRSANAIYEQVAVAEPIIEPIYDTMGLSKILKGIMKEMKIDHLYPKTDNDIKLAPLGVTYDQVLKMGGVYTPKAEFEAKNLTELKTPSGKLELVSQEMKEHGYDALITHKDEWIIEPKAKDEFYITTTRKPTHRHGMTANCLWVNEIHGENFVDINEDRAIELGIGKGDWVRVTSPYGEVDIKARLTQGIRPDTICIPHGFGHKSKFLTLASGKGSNDGDVMPLDTIAEVVKRNDPSGSSFDCHYIIKIKKL